jgi:hypothetical protein
MKPELSGKSYEVDLEGFSKGVLAGIRDIKEAVLIL